jgi:Cu/Ag efflux pump CusA
VLHASSEVSRGIFFAAAIIIASFLPLFTLTGVEGHIFGPMAKTYAYAILGGLIATFTVAPVLATMLLPDDLDEVETWLVRKMRGVYEPAARFALANRVLTLGGAACCSSSPSSACARWAWSSFPIWRKATCISVPKCPPRSALRWPAHGQCHPQGHRQLSRGRKRTRRRDVLTMAPMRPASSTPNSSCR